MSRYFCLQCKRVAKRLPGVMLALALLFGALVGAFQGLRQMLDQGDTTARFQVALAGYTDDPFLEMGMAALQAMDSTRYTIEVLMMEESEAAQALARGEIAAYVVVPEGFMEAALRGDVMPLDYYSTNGAAGLVSMFKEEVTHLISDILVACQKGSYGAGDVLIAQGQADRAYEVMDDISIAYVEFVLARSGTYKVTNLGIDGLELEDYLLTGLCVLLMCLAGLPFAPLWIRQDRALDRMLSAKGLGVAAQTLCDFAAYLAGMLTMMLAALALAAALGLLAGVQPLGWLLLTAILALTTVTAMSFFFYAISGSLMSGVLLQFVVVLAMALVSGCLYPASFFPEAVQRIAAWLPTGLARQGLAESLMGAHPLAIFLGLLGYTGAFILAALGVHQHRVRAVRG